MPNVPQTFHEMLITTREEAGHTVDSMAVLMSLSPEDYDRLEQGKYPDDETLTRMCKMMGWNYYDAQRLIINEMISPHSRPTDPERKPAAKRTAQAGQAQPRQPVPVAGQEYENLSHKLREARANVGQSSEILAMLLKISTEEYEALESGGAPSDDVLRRISMVYNWNYLDLGEMVRAGQASIFQPPVQGRPFAASSAQVGRLKRISDDLQKMFPRLPTDDQLMMLAQLELVRDTMRRHQSTEPEAVAARA